MQSRSGQRARHLRRSALTVTAVVVIGVLTGTTGSASSAVATGRHSAQPATGPSADLEGISTLSTTDAYAAGIFEAASGPQRTYLVHYNGHSWTHVATPNSGAGNNGLYDVLAVASNDVWAAGYSVARRAGLVIHQTGSEWHIVPTPLPPQGRSIYTSLSGTAADDVWAVGWILNGSTEHTLTMHWDGSQWTRVPSPSVGVVSEMTTVHAISPTNVWAMGDALKRSQPLALHWDGTRWSVVPTPKPGGTGATYFMQSVSSSNGKNLWASGPILNAQAGHPTAVTMHWSGRRWINDSSAVPPGGHVLNSYASDVISDSQVWAVGDRLFQGRDHSLAMRKTAPGWRLNGTPVAGDYISFGDVDHTSATDVWAGGVYRATAKAPNRPLLMHWNGHFWSKLVL